MPEFPFEGLSHGDLWPGLPLEKWKETCQTLHMWTQVVGKIRLMATPLVNHWWNVPLYLSARGLTTSPIPNNGRMFQIEFDFIAQVLLIMTSEGKERVLALRPMPVSEFYREVTEALRDLDVTIRIWTRPVEVPDPVSFEKDDARRAYDPEYAWRFWRAMVAMEPVFGWFRSGFCGKCSPLQFFWGGFDLAMTRFSGRPAPQHPPLPFAPASIVREAYSHEVSSCGFWPGGGLVEEAVFYSYAYPEPKGFRTHPIEPIGAYYHPDLGEFLLPYEYVRQSENPAQTLLNFFQSTYVAAADLGGWDRRTLEREPSLYHPHAVSP